MAAKKPQWESRGDSTFAKDLTAVTLVVEQIRMTGEWRAEYYTAPKWGTLQIKRCPTKEEAMQVCEGWAKAKGYM